MTAQRPGPGSAESQYPKCPLCGDVTVFDGSERFTCEDCRCWWPSARYWTSEGEWLDDDADQCSAAVRPYLGDAAHPSIEPKVYRCLLGAGHTARQHRGAEGHSWTDADTDGYVTRLLAHRTPAP